MQYRDVIIDGANPGGNLGAAFSANIGSTQLSPKGKFLDHLIIGLKGTVGTAPVVLENALGALSQFTFKAGQETRIQLSARDLVALMAAFYKQLPFAWENTDSTGSTFILGIKVPIQETIDPTISYTYSANYTAVTNFSSVLLSLTTVYNSDAKGKSPIIAVPISYTTPGATGATAINARLTNLGMLQGLLVFNTTNPSDGADLYDIQRIQLVENGKQTSLLTAANPDPLHGLNTYSTLQPIGEVLMPYLYYDFSEEPFDVKTNFMEFIVDVETVSEATRLIPIITKA
ncbi:MAG: hypothetical protein KGJ58_01670 [Patescibacteria group bacterium]|nr:hypothetical protein [Patescibacteria group bacterium]MDE1988643.1 hypothetical protein [Patescibacteria group bacterium]MDE2218147.1 hypothetical protein [Patescibacteria group bacterium]